MEIKTRHREPNTINAKRIVEFQCSYGGCILNATNRHNAIQSVFSILEQQSEIKQDVKRALIRDKVRSFMTCFVGKRKSHFNWTIGDSPQEVIKNTCKDCFMEAYGIGKTYLQDRISEIK